MGKIENKEIEINWEKISMDIITNAGAAKSSTMEALYFAKQNEYEKTKVKLEESATYMAKASHAHFDVIQKEAEGIQLKFSVLFVHAEDQLLTTQTLILVVEELIDIHKLIKKNKEEM